ncbi:MAG: type II secretion system protein GspN [Deltaproteobacteria bacterium]|nr:type II secretion system protein GspN [Deltaproteobacteria bacterium]
MANIKREKKSRFKKIVLVFLIASAGLLLSSIAAFYIIPLELIDSKVKALAEERAGITITQSGLRRVFPFGLEADNVEAAFKGHEPFVYIDRVRVTPDPLGLLTGRLKANFKGAFGNGDIGGYAALRFGGGAELKFEALGAEFRGVPVFNRVVSGLNGSFSGVAEMSLPDGGCPSGTANFKGEGMKGGEISFRGLPLPLSGIDGSGLEAVFSNCRIELKGFWLEGSDFSARLEGVVILSVPIDRSTLDMTLELIPKGALLRKEYILSLISDYRKSANYYSIPIKGTIGAPRAGF